MLLKTKIKTYDLTQRTYVMGILNVTPDSFSDGGSYTSIDRAVKHAIDMVSEGADIIDIGGESTRPGHTPVTVEEELSRIIPAIQEIRKNVDVPISIDTFKAETARQAIEAGADIINDQWAAKKDPEIAAVAAEYNVPIILMHNREEGQETYTSIIDDMKKDFEESIEIALKAGVPKENIIIDPGLGFAKTHEEHLYVMNHLEEFHALGYPILLATSRKRFIGQVLDIPPLERDLGTGATTCLGITKGVQMVRVHNVKVNVQLSRMMDAMVKA